MSDAPIPIQGVIVEGRSPQPVQVCDTTEYPAGSVKVNRDAPMEDLLSKLPVVVVINGTVTVGGEAVQRVLVGDVTNEVLTRYVMLTFSYTVR